MSVIDQGKFAKEMGRTRLRDARKAIIRDRPTPKKTGKRSRPFKFELEYRYRYHKAFTYLGQWRKIRESFGSATAREQALKHWMKQCRLINRESRNITRIDP